jgi:hypothetical protein
LATAEAPGSVTFYLKDLSNDDQPLQIAKITHELTGGLHNDAAFTIGRVDGNRPAPFDGLVDDIRLIDRAIGQDEILYTVERQTDGTIGFWQFEVDPGVLKNSATSGPELEIDGATHTDWTPRQSAVVDFSHALLNSNEFLYVH